MSKIDEYAINIKTIMIIVFIIMSVIAYFFFSPSSCSRPHKDNSVIALWPPDLIPHPPHFPDPAKPSNPAKVSL